MSVVAVTFWALLLVFSTVVCRCVDTSAYAHTGGGSNNTRSDDVGSNRIPCESACWQGAAEMERFGP